MKSQGCSALPEAVSLARELEQVLANAVFRESVQQFLRAFCNAVCHDIRVFAARILMILPEVRSIHYRQSATDMTIVPCQTRSQVSNDAHREIPTPGLWSIDVSIGWSPFFAVARELALKSPECCEKQQSSFSEHSAVFRANIRHPWNEQSTDATIAG